MEKIRQHWGSVVTCSFVRKRLQILKYIEVNLGPTALF